MKPDLILRGLLPFVPKNRRTTAGVVVFLLGSGLAALTTPEIAPILPQKLQILAPVLQVWGGAAAILGLRAAMPESAPPAK